MTESKQKSATGSIPQTTDEEQTRNTSTEQKPSQPLKNGVFMMRAEGQSFDDYVEAVIEALRAKGLLTEKKPEQK
jgi:hypothetical protein